MSIAVNCPYKFARRPKSGKLNRRARRVLADGVGNDLRRFEPKPVHVAWARGARKWGVDGNDFIDLLLRESARLVALAPYNSY